MLTVKKNFGRRRREKRRVPTPTDKDRSTDQQPYPTPWTERVATEKRQRVYQQQNNVVKKEHEKTLQNIRRERRTFKKDMRKAMALIRESLSKITTTDERQPGRSRGHQKFVHFPQLPRTSESNVSGRANHTETKFPTVVGVETPRQPSESVEDVETSKEDRSLPILKKWTETALTPESHIQPNNSTSFPQVGKRKNSQVFVTSLASHTDITSAAKSSVRKKSLAPQSKPDQIPLHTLIEETESAVNEESDNGEESVAIVASTDVESPVPAVVETNLKTRCRTWPGEGPIEMFPASGYTSDMMSRLLQNGVLYTYRPATVNKAPLWPEPDPDTRLRAASLRSDALIRAGKDGGGIRAWLGLGSEQELKPAKPSIGRRRKSIVQLRRESLWSLDNYEYHYSS